MLPGSGAPQPAIEIYDAQGNPVGQPLSGNFAGVDVVKPAAGVYTVLALDTSTTPGASSFTLDLMRTTNACSVPAAQGATVNGVVSAAAPFLAYSIAASSGDVLALRSSSSTASFAAQMELYGPDGGRLDSGVFSLSRKAAASGNYTVLLGAAAPRTAGGYSFAWQLMNQPAGARRSPAAVPRTGALSPAQPVPLLHARRRCRRYPARAVHPHQRQLLAADRDLRPRGRAHRRQFRRHAKGRRRRQLSGTGQPLHQFTETGSYTSPSSGPTTPVRRVADLRTDHPAPGDIFPDSSTPSPSTPPAATRPPSG